MAVQAQYRSKAFMPEFQSRGRDSRDYYVSASASASPSMMVQGAPVADEFHHNANVVAVAPNLLCLYNSGNYGARNGTVFSSDPESELTCNSRKRPIDEDALAMAQHQQQQQQLQLMTSMASEFQQQQKSIPPHPHAHAQQVAQTVPPPLLVSTGLQLAYDDTRLNQSAATSTSGRAAAVPMAMSTVLGDDLTVQLQQHNEEIERMLRLQTDKVLVALEEKMQRHSRTLLSIMEERMMLKLREKETELENAVRRNAEMEEKLKQLAMDKRLWQTMAQKNEAMVSSLRTSLEQVVAQCKEHYREGVGDSEADDAQSCCNDGSASAETQVHVRMLRENKRLKQQRICRVCRRNDICILLFPCRHLCLCKECESRIHNCPICHSIKDARVQIYMS